MSPPLWVVTGVQSAVHLFGQAPWGVQVSDPWFDGATRSAFERSTAFQCEIPDDPQLRDPDMLAVYGLATTPLSAVLDPPTAKRMSEAARAAGVEPASLESCRPWLAAQILDNAMRAGVRGDLIDAEADLTRRARAQGSLVQFEWDRAGDVFAYFTSLGDAESDYLRWTADRVVEGPAVLLRNATQWLAGELGGFEEEIAATRKVSPSLFEALLQRRNDAWIPRIEAALDQHAETFILMGMAHLLGTDGVLAQLQRRGHSVRRVQ